MGPASFRGAAFHVESSEHSGGRRGVTHEYPFKDRAYREDLGGSARAFGVDGFVIGAEYMAARDALRAELEKAGPGRLVHPYYGELTVSVDSFKISERTSDGGMARFSIEFVESESKPVQPVARVDAPEQVRASAVAAREAVTAAFLSAYQPGSTPYTPSLSNMLGSATTAVESALSRVQLDTQSAAIQRLRLVRNRDDLAGLARAPGEIVDTVAALLGGFVGAGMSRAVASVYSFAPGVRPPSTTPSRRQEQVNFDTLKAFVQRSVAVRVAELALEENFASYTDAVTARDHVTTMVDEQAEAVTDDAFPALYQLRADVVRALPPPDADLPRLLPMSPVETTPSLVLVYQIYGSLTLEADLVERNSVRNPCFVLAGRQLEVLSDA
nr:DNA circularization N-terminal domain-containing protein [Myxococcus stipitatus]